MGLFQSHVGYCSCAGIARLRSLAKAITVYSLAHATLALKVASETGQPVLLISAPFAAGTTGPAWFNSVVSQAMDAVPDADATSMLDCGNMAGFAMASLRQGIKYIRFDGETFDKIASIAEQLKARVTNERPDSLDLYALELQGKQLDDACKNWLLDLD